MSLVQKLLRSDLIKSTGIYTIAGIINGLIVFILLPFYTRYMTPDEYGMVSMFRTIASFVFPFIAFNASIPRAFFDRDEIDFPKYVFNAISIIVMNTIIIACVMYLLNAVIFKYTLFPESYFWTVLLFSFSTSFMKLGLGLLQVYKKPLLYGILQISATVLNFSVAIFLVAHLKMNWQGAVLADSLVLGIFFLIITLVLIKMKFIKVGFSREYIKDILLFNAPLILHLVGRGVITMSDKIFITNMVDIAATGIYATGYQVGMVIFVLSTSFQAAWMPHLFEILKRNEAKELKQIVQQVKMYSGGIIAVAAALGLLAPFIVDIFLGELFQASSGFVIWIALGFAFNGIYLVLSSIITFSKKTVYLSVITIIGALVNIVLNYSLIKENGAIGAAQSTTITFLIISILTFVFSRKLVNLPWVGFKM